MTSNMKIIPLPEVCDVVDDLSGAKCTLEAFHILPHLDESDPQCVIQFKDVAQLIVPDSGTDIFELELPPSMPPVDQSMWGYYG